MTTKRPPVTPRIRLVGVVVQPQLVADDGTELTPLTASQLVIAPADVPRLADILDEAIAQAEASLYGAAS